MGRSVSTPDTVLGFQCKAGTTVGATNAFIFWLELWTCTEREREREPYLRLSYCQWARPPVDHSQAARRSTPRWGSPTLYGKISISPYLDLSLTNLQPAYIESILRIRLKYCFKFMKIYHLCCVIFIYVARYIVDFNFFKNRNRSTCHKFQQ